MCKKSKFRNKAIRIVFALLMIFVHCGNSENQSCFGSVWKVKIVSDDQLHVGVNGTQIRSNIEDSYFYKISAPNSSSFYLFDYKSKMFICWKKKQDKMVPMRVQRINRLNHWDFCRFGDTPSKTKNSTHVHLYSAKNSKYLMQFDSKGRQFPVKKVNECKTHNRLSQMTTIPMRHSRKKKCRVFNNFMIYDAERCCCQSAYANLCKHKYGLSKFMPELLCPGPESKCECH